MTIIIIIIIRNNNNNYNSNNNNTEADTIKKVGMKKKIKTEYLRKKSY